MMNNNLGNNLAPADNLSADEELIFNEIGIKTKTKAFKRYYNAGLLENKDSLYVDEVRSYWLENYNKEIDPVLHLASLNLTGKRDKRIVPAPVMWHEIIPFLNDQNMAVGYRDKNIYDNLFNTPRAAEIVLKRIRGRYFDTNNNAIDKVQANKVLLNDNDSLIIKPSDTNDGHGIEKIDCKDGELLLNNERITITDLEAMYEYNFIAQKVIQQHPIMAAPHPASVNTLRMVTMRWNNEIKYLSTFARFGANDAVKDNAGAGGICIGVTNTGEFMDIALDEHCTTYSYHPTTSFDFSQLEQIPNFEKFIKLVTELHKDILHLDYISWDIAVGVDGLPVFIEANFAGATWLYQLAFQGPLFGDDTQEIIQYISKNLKGSKTRDIGSPNSIFRARKKHPKRKGQRRNERRLNRKNKELDIITKELEVKNKKLNATIDLQQQEIQSTKDEINRLKQSRSWRYTSLLRSKK